MNDHPCNAAKDSSLAGRAEPAPPCTLVIFGATGDLTHRLLMPALYNLARWELLSEKFAIVGVARAGGDKDTDAYRSDLTKTIEGFVQKGGEFSPKSIDEAAWRRIVDKVEFHTGDLADEATYTELKARLADLEGKHGTGGNVLFYLAVAASLFGPTIEHLAKAGLTEERDGLWRRIIVEKPFGHDLPSARALNARILSVVQESQVYRIDHFLGKETVQNIMAFRFGNGLFEPLWNRDHVDHVEITVAETVGVEARGKFYEATGALRDMVPNHLFQLFTMVAMEPPNSFDAEAVRNKKEDVLLALKPTKPGDAVRAQYAAGTVVGRPVRDYRAEPDVAPDSHTETYVAVKLTVDNWRWAGVPFYLRTGKSMARRDTEIAIRFKQAPLALFRGTDTREPVENWLVLQLQPDEGISLQFGAKVPGPGVSVRAVEMDFSYKDYFQAEPSTGYETLIYDAMIGDATLYQRADTIEAGWRAVQPILDAWGASTDDLPTYPAGSAGPKEADDLLARDGRAWRPLHEAES